MRAIYAIVGALIGAAVDLTINLLAGLWLGQLIVLKSSSTGTTDIPPMSPSPQILVKPHPCQNH